MKIKLALGVMLLALMASFSFAQDTAPNVYVGTSAVDMTPPIGVPLAGYGGPGRRLPLDILSKYRYATFLKPSKGVHDPIRAKAFLIKTKEKALLFLSMDVVGVDYPFYKKIKAYAASLGIDDLFLSATHTHSGPGTLSKSLVYEVIATDLYQPKIYKLVLNSVKHAIDLAYQDLQPAQLFKTTFQAPGIQLNRRDRPGHFDPNAHLLFSKTADGKIQGGIVNFAVHPVALGQKNLLFTADLAGGIENAVKSALHTTGEILFVNGTEGDVSTTADGFKGITQRSADFGAVAETAVILATPVKPQWKTRAMMIDMPKAKLALWACDDKIRKIFKRIKIPVGRKLLPTVGEIKQLILDDVMMMTWPGEATTDVGFAAKQKAAAFGYPETWNLGLTNGYMGYFVTQDEYNVGGYEVCTNYHGPKGTQTLLDSHQKLLNGDPP